MIHKKGFSFIETIVTIVVLSTSLLYIYSSYSNIITNEERRLTFDDIAYIYKTDYVKKYLESNVNIERIKTNDLASTNSYVLTIGPNYGNLSTNPNVSTELEAIMNGFHIYRIVIVDAQIFEDCTFSDQDTNKCVVSGDCKCFNSKENITINMQNYLKSLNSSENTYYLAIEYSEKLDDNGKIVNCIPNSEDTRTDKGYRNCNFSYYSSLGI